MQEHLGKVVEWRDERGFGFIEVRESGERLFFHVRDYRQDGRRPEAGEWVKLRRQRGPEGRWQAVQVRRATAPARRAEKPEHRPRAQLPFAIPVSLQWLLIVAYVGGLAWAVDARRLPLEFVGVPLLLSAITWVAYALDKHAAQTGRWRTPESMLHLLELLGGWPGAIAAQQWLRHKSRKPGYRVLFWCVVVLHCAALAAWVLRRG